MYFRLSSAIVALTAITGVCTAQQVNDLRPLATPEAASEDARDQTARANRILAAKQGGELGLGAKLNSSANLNPLALAGLSMCSDGTGLAVDTDLGVLAPGVTVEFADTTGLSNGICAYSFFLAPVGPVPQSGGDFIATFEVSEPVVASAVTFSTPGGMSAFILNGAFTFEEPDILGDGSGLMGLVADDTVGFYDGDSGFGPFLNASGAQQVLLPGVTHYLVFDGLNGAEGFFDIDFILEPTATGGSCSDGTGLLPDGDLGILGPSVTIQDGDTSTSGSSICAYSFFGAPVGPVPMSGGDLVFTFEVSEPVTASFTTFSGFGGAFYFILNDDFVFNNPDILDDGGSLSGDQADDAIGVADLSLGFGPFVDSTGAQTVLLPGVTHYLVIDGLNGADGFADIDFILEALPDLVECPPGGLPENAFECVDGVSDSNGGCNSVPEQFQPIALGDTVCGEQGNFTDPTGGGLRDTDWYELNVAAPTQITITYTGGSDALVGLAGQIVPGLPGCANDTGFLDPFVFPDAGVETQLVVDLPAAGTYYVFVGDAFSGAPCGTPYVLTVDGDDCVFTGCNPADVNEDGALTFGDVTAFTVAFNAGDVLPVCADGDASADTTGDGILTFGDVTTFVDNFNSGAGCP